MRLLTFRPESCVIFVLLLCCGCGSEEPAPPDRDTSTSESNSASSDGARPADPPSTSAATKPTTAVSGSVEPPSKLYGSWVANNVNAPIGQVKIRLTFKKSGPVKLLAWSELPFVGQVKEVSAPFEVTDHTLHSDAIRGGTTVQYRFDGETLIIEYQDGSTIRFHRT